MVSNQTGPLLYLVSHREPSSAPCYSHITADIHVESEIRLFADDCVCYREIKDKEDTLKLQRDIDRLGNWARKWGNEIPTCQMQHDAADKQKFE